MTSKLGIFNIFKAAKTNIKSTLQKRNFKVLVFKSRRSLWGHAWCHKKYILLTFKGICMNFSLELKKNILSHPVTSKQPHKIVQILMRHPVFVDFKFKISEGYDQTWSFPVPALLTVSAKLRQPTGQRQENFNFACSLLKF